MTTIAYDGRYIAADGMRGDSRIKAEMDLNKFREFNGWWAALCGDVCAHDLFCAEFEIHTKTSLPDEYRPSGIGYHSTHGDCRIGLTTQGLYYFE